MPCHSDYGDPIREQMRATAAVATRETKRELDRVTRLLCGVMGWMELQGYTTHDPDLDAELAAWWERHKAFDEQTKGEGNA